MNYDDRSPGEVAFNAYSAAVGGKAYNGEPLPSWDTVKTKSPRIRDAWEAAARHVRAQLQREQAVGKRR